MRKKLDELIYTTCVVLGVMAAGLSAMSAVCYDFSFAIRMAIVLVGCAGYCFLSTWIEWLANRPD